jgi:NADPH:quinone reductase
MSTNTYLALGIESCGPPEFIKLLEISNPLIIPSTSVFIRVHAVAANRVDLIKRMMPFFSIPPSPNNPQILGWDGSGVIEKIGDKVEKFKPGDEVYFSGNISEGGCFAECIILDELLIAKKPKNMDFPSAAAFPLTGLTAWEVLEDCLGLSVKNIDDIKKKVGEKEEYILIVGGGGGIGSILSQLSTTIFGLKVISTASRPESEKFSKEMGANHVINHKENYKEQINALNIPGFKGINYVVCTSELTNELLGIFESLMVSGGKIVCLNVLPFSKFEFCGGLFLKKIAIIFESVFGRVILGEETEKIGERLSAIANLVENGVIKSTVGKREKFSLESIIGVQDALWNMSNIGKVVFEDVQEYFSNLKK